MSSTEPNQHSEDSTPSPSPIPSPVPAATPVPTAAPTTKKETAPVTTVTVDAPAPAASNPEHAGEVKEPHHTDTQDRRSSVKRVLGVHGSDLSLLKGHHKVPSQAMDIGSPTSPADDSSANSSVQSSVRRLNTGSVSGDVSPAAAAPTERKYPTNVQSYEILSELGVGGFDVVYRAKVKGNDDLDEVAVKVVDLETLDLEFETIASEIQTMSSLLHDNIVRILASFVEGSYLWIVMPLFKGGSFRRILKTVAPSGLNDECLIATVLDQALCGLEYLHAHGMIHRDVKAGNLLLKSNGCVQLSDFGVAASLVEGGSRKRSVKTFVGTPCWMAPEVIEQANIENGYDEKVDIWSLGITALELAFGLPPYAEYPRMKVMILLLESDPPGVHCYDGAQKEMSKAFIKFVDMCLKKRPEKRATAAELRKSKFIRKFSRGPSYIEENLLSQLPEGYMKMGTAPSEETKARLGAITGAPAPSVRASGEWVFDDVVTSPTPPADSLVDGTDVATAAVSVKVDTHAAASEEKGAGSNDELTPRDTTVVSVSESPGYETDTPSATHKVGTSSVGTTQSAKVVSKKTPIESEPRSEASTAASEADASKSERKGSKGVRKGRFLVEDL